MWMLTKTKHMIMTCQILHSSSRIISLQPWRLLGHARPSRWSLLPDAAVRRVPVGPRALYANWTRSSMDDYRTTRVLRCLEMKEAVFCGLERRYRK